MRFSIRLKLLSGFLLISLIIAASGMVNRIQLDRVNHEAIHMGEMDAPLVGAIMEAKFLATNADFKMEKIIAGSSSEEIGEVWKLFDLAISYCDAVLDGGMVRGHHYVSTSDASMRRLVEESRRNIRAMKQTSQKVYEHFVRYKSSVSGSVLDNEMDAVYQRILGKLDVLAEEENLAEQVNYYKYLLADSHLSLEEILQGDTTEQWEIVRSRMQDLAADLTVLVRKDDEKYAGLNRSLAALIEFAEKRYAEQSNFLAGKKQLDLEFAETFEAFAGHAFRVTETIESHIHKRVGIVSDNVAQGNRFNLLATIFGLSVSLLAGFFLAAHLSAPIKRLSNSLDKMAIGDFRDLAYFTRSDEIGDIFNSYRKVGSTMREITGLARKVSEGDYSTGITPRSEHDRLCMALSEMTAKLKEITEINKKQMWLVSTQSGLTEVIRGRLDLSVIGNNTCSYLAKNINAQIASFYILEENELLKLYGSYAFQLRKEIGDTIKLGSDLLGQAVIEKELISVTEIPDDHIRVRSSLGHSRPRNLLVIPFIHEQAVKGVIELASCAEFTEEHLQLLENTMESVAIAVNSAQIHARMDVLLTEARERSEELQLQQEELQASNEELEENAKRLQESEQELQAQQEELQAINEELEEKTKSLELQGGEINRKNLDLERTAVKLAEKAQQLELTSKYKSEFLANMSHELRTPLNSLLILAQSLQENQEKNLSEDQIRSAAIIYNSGNELLALINEILDLSKIEAGKTTVSRDNILFAELHAEIKAKFDHVAKEKGIGLTVEIEAGLPDHFISDVEKVERVIGNLVANAIKFTKEGEVAVRFHPVKADTDLADAGIIPENSFAVTVSDTGIGIPADKHADIFEAFQQADGSTSREFGGTGLGLSITRELVKLLGGQLKLTSKVGEGSQFTVYLPTRPLGAEDEETSTSERQSGKAKPVAAKKMYPPQKIPAPSIADDRLTITGDDKVILIIDDDLNFAEILAKLCHDKGYKFLHSGDGETGLSLASRYLPDGIILDLHLPGLLGADVLDSLKSNPLTRHIPVNIMSVDEVDKTLIQKGAIDYICKPVSSEKLGQAIDKISAVADKRVKEILIVEDDNNLCLALKKMIDSKTVQTTAFNSGEEAYAAICHKDFDCIIIDLRLPDITGNELLERIAGNESIRKPPVIVYTGKDLSRKEEAQLQEHASSVILKTAFSTERLLEETSLFLHRVNQNLPPRKSTDALGYLDDEKYFKDRRILLTDDDMRNLFAVAKILEDRGCQVFKAVNGEEALKVLEKEEVDIVLMDIMMPGLDGYETMKIIRSKKQYRDLPIIALTAKAMPADRNKCIEAGANDYIAKPVEIKSLLSLLRVWLS